MAMPESPVEDVGGAVLFGVDGTLMDTVYLHTVAWAEALRRRGRHVATALVHRSVGMRADALLDALLGADRDRGGDAALAAAHDTLYTQYASRAAPLPGARELVRACAVRGWKVVLASSAAHEEAGATVRALGAGDVIAAVAAGGDVPSGEPAPDVVQLALAKAGVPAERALFVGATAWDGRAAATAGVRCLGLLTGGWTRRELHEAGMDAVYDSPAELLARLDDSLLAAPPGWA